MGLREKFERLVLESEAGKNDPEGIAGLWNSLSYRMYSLEERHRVLGLGPKCTSSYYSFTCDMDDAKLAQEFMLSKNLAAFNTRLIKKSLHEYEIRLASSETGDGVVPGCDKCLLGSHEFTAEGADAPVTFHITRGDYSKLLAKVVTCFEKAREFATTEAESRMLDGYIVSFTTGSVPSHMDMARIWIKNKSPAVETFFAFLESYRDPLGVRAEFEAFVGFVNKERSAKYQELVNNTERLLKTLPWPAEYEMDKFLRPDTLSIDLLTYGASGVPDGCNIPYSSGGDVGHKVPKLRGFLRRMPRGTIDIKVIIRTISGMLSGHVHGRHEGQSQTPRTTDEGYPAICIAIWPCSWWLSGHVHIRHLGQSQTPMTISGRLSCHVHGRHHGQSQRGYLTDNLRELPGYDNDRQAQWLRLMIIINQF
ncbi:hypothetical protein DPMN_044827 [Dreissena polymorpha]|uniref:Uncharacterized protein n=1 Tax=Dreissena polymorpha TaxID=45954 RepID=A0A9D4D585_DREPO|nr:hypothetical protein DPMN_044827 [Dreissena polymorpha]